MDASTDSIGLTVVTDAKDVYDKGSSDTHSYGSQKSLAFTVAWIRGMLQRASTSLRWTSTENMFVDAGTKDMDLAHVQRILDDRLARRCLAAAPDHPERVYRLA